MAAPAFAQTETSAALLTNQSYPFTLPKLSYATSALNPVIDTETMETHHGKHHKTYVDKLNDALKDHGELQKMDLVSLINKADQLPDTVRTAVKNHGGGHLNHTLFWDVMGAPDANAKPTGALEQAIISGFGSLDDFKKQFNSTGEKQFGSGWVFVTVDDAGKLALQPLPNQDSPLSQGKKVLFLNDVWEHAYYLTYRNRRAEYLQAWWQVVDWTKLSARYDALKSGQGII